MFSHIQADLFFWKPILVVKIVIILRKGSNLTVRNDITSVMFLAFNQYRVKES